MKNIIQTAFIMIFAIALTGLYSKSIYAAPPENDHWQNATVITGTSGTMLGSNIDATAQFCEPVNYFGTSVARPSVQSVWYAWTPTENASYTFKVNSTNAPITISAYRMTYQVCENLPGLFPTMVAENWSFDYNTSRSQITFAATAGQTYYLKLSALPTDIQSAIFTFGWQKTKFQYFSRLTDVDSSGEPFVARGETHYKWYSADDFALRSPRARFTTFGLVGDKTLSGDYDGDGQADLVAIRSENGNYVWYIGKKTGELIKTVTFGWISDKPIVGDFDGDGIADVAVVRKNAENNSLTWHILRSSDGVHQQIVHGEYFDLTWVGDYNGDGKSDPIAIRTDFQTQKQTWHILLSTSGSVLVKPFGQNGDIPQSADFDGDGKTDICVFRKTDIFGNGQAGNWYYVRSSMGTNSQIQIVKWGQEGDVPQAMPFYNNGKYSFVIYRNGVWWVYSPDYLLNEYYTINYGLPNDHPMSDLGQQLYLFNN